jgi:hypothetical protein
MADNQRRSNEKKVQNDFEGKVWSRNPFGNRGLVVRAAVDGHVKCSLFAEFPFLLQVSKTVSKQESCPIVLGIGKRNDNTKWRVWAKVEGLERGRDNGRAPDCSGTGALSAEH